MHAEQVLDMQADLVARSQTDIFQEFIGYVMREVISANRRSLSIKGTLARREDPYAAMAAALAKTIPTMSKVAYAYLVTPDMVDLAVHAAHGLDHSDRFRRDLLPTPSGFMVFGKPLEVRDLRGVVTSIHHVLWGPSLLSDSSSAIVLHAFTDRTREDPALLRERMLRYRDPESQTPVSEERATEMEEIFRASIGSRWDYLTLQVYDEGLAVGSERIPLDQETVDRVRSDGWGGEPQSPDNLLRIMFAVWRLLGQTIAQVDEADLSRHARKRARRAGIPDRVSVIDLRRVEGRRDGEGGHVEWSHRWYSRGHWAWRKCSEHHPLAEPDPSGGWRARVWVRESIKGPADKPLVITDKVYVLRR